MKNTTTPMDDNGDDSFDWREDWEPMTPEELEAAFPDIHEDVTNSAWEDPYLQGGHYEANEYMEGESW
jgi:hypothetical protein